MNRIMNRVANSIRVATGRPARWMSDAEMSGRLRRGEAARRQTSLALAELEQAAARYGLPLPFEPTAIVGGVIVHPARDAR